MVNLPSPLMIIFRQVAHGRLEKYSWLSARRTPCWRTAACPAWSSGPEQWRPTTLPSRTTTRPIPRIWKGADAAIHSAVIPLFRDACPHTDLAAVLFFLFFLTRKHLHPQTQQSEEVNFGQPGAMTWARIETKHSTQMFFFTYKIVLA